MCATVQATKPFNMSLNKNEKEAILRKLQSGDLELLKDAIEKYPNIKLSELLYEQTGDSALHIAARLCNVNDLHYFLQTFSPDYVNFRNKDDKTPLHEAVQFSKYENVHLLLENGADVNALKRSDWTPLMLACTKTNANSGKIARLLIARGAVLDHKNKDGWCSLHFACKEGNVEIVRLLLEKGADSTAETRNGRTALHIAALHCHDGVVRELLKLKPDINTIDCCGNTPFLEAVLGGCLTTCKTLLRNGADAHTTNSFGFGALHLAVSIEDSREMIRFLVNDLHLDVNAMSRMGMRPLHCAARADNTINYNLLVSLGANRKLKDTFKRLSFEYFTVPN